MFVYQITNMKFTLVLYYHYEIFIHGYNHSAISSGHYQCGLEIQ